MNQKSKFKPLYKKFCRLRQNVQNRTKLFKFKKTKWKKLLKYLKKSRKYKEKKYFDHFIYNKPKYSFRFKKNFIQKLHMKQMFKLFYGGLTNSYLKNISKKANKCFFNTSNKMFFTNTILNQSFFIELLESRIDNILYRSNFVLSIRKARQAISHGHIYVNNVKIKDNSYFVKKGDLIIINIKSCYLIKNIRNKFLFIPPKYLLINYKTFQIYVIANIRITKIINIFPFKININSLLKIFSL